ncbi:tetratricopeptide repeat protein [Flagellimonas lutaonensis]|uniref:histidine kinase n=1 Tax=Flagellimonas lutaonensis TaxID=516051 RepID=A0A0D5YTA3_9FLAO|nr:tetratricopeptide repeat protein [Allomuricauda lutaonensis]AKA35086.1 Putative two-component system sensor kinase/response regulator fusion protein [Allomuricauda lutaonensis]
MKIEYLVESILFVIKSVKILLLLISICTYSQSRIDSHLQELTTLPQDSTKIQAYLDLSWAFLRKDLEASLRYADSAEQLSEKLELLSFLAESNRVKSFALSGMGKYDEAETGLDKALSLFSRLDNQKMIVDTKVEFGWLKQIQSQYEAAMEYYMEALPLAEELHYKNNEARIHSYMGGIYKIQKQYVKAIDHYRTALGIVENLNIKPGISACLTNIASTYNEMGTYDSALVYNKRALFLKKELGDDLGTGRVLNNLGVVYNNLESFDEAERSFSEAFSYAKKVNNPKLIATVQYGMVSSVFGKGEYQKSIELAKELLGSIDSLADLDLKVKIHQKMAKAYEKMGDYQNAYLNASKGQILSDSLYNERILKVTNDLEAKYQNEQKTKEIALLASEKELQTLQLNKRENERNAIIALAVLALLISGLLYNQYRIKQKTNNELQALDKAKSNFFANISHEFRTPLTLIKGPIEQLEQNPDEKLDREDIKMIRRNTNRVLGLVNQLLDLSRIDQGSLKLKATEGDIYKCLRAAASSFNSHAAQRNMDFRVSIPDGILWAAFDRDKLEKIVYNLLSNAFKFSDDGELVTFGANYGNGELNIQVSDSGRGISEEKLPFIFDRFYQVDSGSTKEREGSGIGLSLSKDLVELMDGTITVSSEEGKGTYFTVQIPIEKIETRQSKSKKMTKPIAKDFPKAQTSDLAKADKRNLPKVLLVEDNEDMRQFIKGHLQKDYLIQEAVNGQDGLKKAVSNPPDLVVTDLMMPKMDGIDLCKQLKTKVETSHIPIIMLTARAGVENKIEGLETGADDYLTKPFAANELLARAKNLIQQRQKLRELFSKSKATVDPKEIAVNSIDQKFLEQVLELLEKEHSDPAFGVSQMQKELAMSKTQLHRKLKALTNETPGELLRNFRLKRAAQLLSQKADTVTQIAYQVGFNNLSYFAKCFKERFGVSPSSY